MEGYNMSGATGFESIIYDLFINGFAAVSFALVFYAVLCFLFIKRNSEFSKYLIGIGILSYIGYLYFAWSYCAPSFKIFSDANIFVVHPLSFVFCATLLLIVLPVIAVIFAAIQSLG